MKLTEFSYRNIISYGNVLQTFTFGDSPRLILVEGENGAGKSSIKEALTISIYGRSAIRKMKDIPNWINRNAYTSVKFLNELNEVVEISRGIDPNFSDIKINGASYNLPDKRKVDEYVEDDLIKIPFSVFCNTISLSFDDFKSFVNLSQSDKRKIVDRIFGIDILSEMRAIVKKDLSQNKKDLELINNQIEKNTETITNSLDQINKLKEKFSKKKEQKSDLLISEIEDKKKKLETTRSTYSGFKSKIEKAQLNVNSVRDSISSNKASISDLSNKLELYKKNRCPYCLNDLTSAASLKTKEIIENKKKEVEENLPQLKTKFTELSKMVDDLVENQNLSKSEFFEIEASIKQLEKNLKALSLELEEDQTSSIQAIIDSLQNDLDKNEKEALEIDHEVSLFNTLDHLLSDSGIKKTLIDKIIPTLNQRIQEISEKLEFKFSFSFDNEFDPHIMYLGMEISPESLSSGQRKKMNLIVLLAFIEIIKMKHNQMNVMFLDEIFSSLDKNNVYKAIEILKEYANKYNLTIFVVSHESLPEEFFDTKILVQQKDHFSEMVITESLKKEN
jgi:DNA repair exonuclease SbcCD ATPase subunit